MKSHPLAMQILASLSDAEQEDDQQMALLLEQLAALSPRELPIAEIAAFLLAPCEGSSDIWVLESGHFDTWEVGMDLIQRDPDRVPVEPVVAAV